jgi:dolichyl-phosphate beta-glucosyltransferase
MAGRAAHVSLVVPVHHCTGSLDVLLGELGDFVRNAPVPTELVLVDDRGSQPGASAELQRFAGRPHVRVLQNDRNRGKGFSVARGMLGATGAFRVFTDADLAYPLDEVWKIVSVLERGADVAIACRVLPESQYTMSARYLRYIYTRHVMSRVFNRMVRMTLIPGVLDTQAGLKGYTAAAAREVFSRVRIAGFGFDLESLFVARRLGLRIDQVPVRFRYNDEPTTVRFVRDARRMAADLARIRWRGWTGEYGTSRDLTAAQASPPKDEDPSERSREREATVP